MDEVRPMASFRRTVVISIVRAKELLFPGCKLLTRFAQGDGGQAVGLRIEVGADRFALLLDALAQQPRRWPW